MFQLRGLGLKAAPRLIKLAPHLRDASGRKREPLGCGVSGLTARQSAGAARLFSMTASCKANCAEPFAYLRDLFARLPLLGDSPDPMQLDELLPDCWLATHPDHRWWIDDLRRAERRPAK